VDAVADIVLTGEATRDEFGVSVGTAGDVNGDGYTDVIVGAYFNDAGGTDAGRAYVYHGGPAADTVADLVLTGEAAGDRFGLSVGTAGDVNGDGYADVIVGADGNDAGGASAGRAYVYHGSPGADAVADLVLTGEAATDQFGFSVGTAGDVNGDGFTDVIVGAYWNDAGGTDAGRAYLYDCNRYFVLSPDGGDTWNVGGGETIAWLGAEPADLLLSVDGGNSYSTLKTGVGGSGSNTVALTVPHQPTRFAKVRVIPADASVGGMGESDSLFTIEANITLLSLKAQPGGGGVVLSWNTEPTVGPDGLAGYRVFRLGRDETGNGVRIGPSLIAETTYTDTQGLPGHSYRLVGVNGLQEEMELGRVAYAAPFVGLRAWPSPVRALGALQIQFVIPLGSAGLPAADMDVAVFNLAGRRIANLARGQLVAESGIISITWDLQGRVASGVYFVRAAAPSVGFEAKQKVVVMQ
jgi:hypothetical protein